MPLRNLFLYIRDIYDVSEITYEFTQEKGNHKMEGLNYWSIAKLLELQSICEEKGMKDLTLSLSSSTNDIDGDQLLLRIRPISKIPDEPIPPDQLRPWILYNRQSGGIPSIECKEPANPFEWFAESEQRQLDYENFCLEVGDKYLYDLSGIPYSLDNWVYLENGRIRKIEKKKINIDMSNTNLIGAQYAEFKRKFENHYDKHWIAHVINDLYHAFHSLYYHLKGRDNKQLCLSFGLVSGVIGGVQYRNFSFHVPLTLKLKNRAFEIHMDSFNTRIHGECNYVSLLEKHLSNMSSESITAVRQSILDQVDEFNSKKHAFVFDPEYIDSEFMCAAKDWIRYFPDQQVVPYLHSKPSALDGSRKDHDDLLLNYGFYPTAGSDNIQLSFSPVIQTRIVESYSAISRDASRIVRTIDMLESQGQTQKIPPLFKKMFALKNCEDADIQGKNNHIREEDFLFPLPYNNEQLEIVQRLSEDDTVIVKGPPGTGKSHTIANIASHYVAQGKSILVVSQNAQALNVVRDKLPEEIRSLAVSFLGQGKSNEMLKNSVNSIIRALSSSYSETYNELLFSDLSTLKANYVSSKNDLVARIQANQKLFRIGSIPEMFCSQGEESGGWLKSAADIAEIYSRHTCIVNPIKDNVSFDESHIDEIHLIENMLKMKGLLKPEEYALFELDCVSDEHILNPDERSKIIYQVKAIQGQIDIKQYDRKSLDVFDEVFFGNTFRFLGLWEALESDSLCQEIMNSSKFDFQSMKTIYNRFSELRELISQREIEFVDYSIEVPNDINGDIKPMLSSIDSLIAKHGNSNSLSPIAKALLPSAQKKIFACKINYSYVVTRDDVKLVREYLQNLHDIRMVIIAFSNYLNMLGVQDSISGLDDIKPLDTVYRYFDTLEQLNEMLANHNLPVIKPEEENALNYVKHLMGLKRYAEYCELMDTLAGYANEYRTYNNTHPVMRSMAESIIATDSDEYNSHYADYIAFMKLHPKLLIYRKAYYEMHNLLPDTAAHIHLQLVENEQLNELNEIASCMFLARLRSILVSCSESIGNIENSILNLHKLRKEIMKKTSELVAYNAWYLKSKSISDYQKSALNAWLNDLTNIGKGYGKNTAKNLASAIRNMEKAKNAVPIWIMTLSDAITFFQDTTPSQFDLMIIDEASQCDFSAFNVAFRCAKLIIVGDENQTAVAIDSSKFPIKKVSHLLDLHLPKHDYKEQFNVTNKSNSIYSICSVLYPNIITLFEHFRCLPEIIGFSNKWIYNNEIIPLRSCADYPYGNPVETFYIDEHTKDDSRPKLVEEAVKYIELLLANVPENSKYPTIGILTLDSSNTKHQKALINRMSQSELIKQHEEEIELVIGTSREFQGDERDIVIMTITTSSAVLNEDSTVSHRVLPKISSEEYMRIFNVASSRAMFKSVLFHSISLDTVPLMQTDCWRKRILDYYHNIKPVYEINRDSIESIMEKLDNNLGDFGNQICRFLYDSGYRNCLFPGYKLGKYSIDIAILNNEKTLAIQCDGYESLLGSDNIDAHREGSELLNKIENQMVLERVGWKVYRIQRVQWFYENEVSKIKLLRWIKTYIEPVKQVMNNDR